MDIQNKNDDLLKTDLTIAAIGIGVILISNLLGRRSGFNKGYVQGTVDAVNAIKDFCSTI